MMPIWRGWSADSDGHAMHAAALLATLLLLAAPAVAQPRQQGSLTLQPCGPAWCGTLTRALDPAGEQPGSLDIAFEFHPQTDGSQPNAGTIVAAEGGPGYPSTGSRSSYLALMAPLRNDRHLLLMDQRGSGRSAPLRCPALQADAFFSADSVAACGRQLGARAALFGSALAADDLAALLDALQIGTVDLYGDSYGTFFAQAFAGRHPQRLRSLVLDGAYAVTGADPWYPEAPLQAQAAFNRACQQDPGCAALPGPSMQRIETLLAQLRARPVTATAPDGNGQPQTTTADARGLAYVMLSNASGPVVYRELDAAARAWGQGDTAPLLRLVAENQTSASSSGGVHARRFSAGLFAAVSCADYPQIFEMAATPAQRRRQADAAIAAKQASAPAVFAPFSIAEFLSLPQDYSVLELCIPWPVPSAAHPAGAPVPAGTVFPAVPVLVLSGEFDSLTPPAQGAQAAALFGNAHQVVLANSFHVTALGDFDGCASALVERFVATLSPGDTGCASRVPAWRLLAGFATQSRQLPTPQPGPGNMATAVQLQRAAAALHAAADVLARWWVNSSGSGVGLRGGHFSYSSGVGDTRFTLDGLRWTEDVAVSGSLQWQYSSGRVRATLQLDGGTLQAEWPLRAPGATATLQGSLDGRRVVATMPAP